MALTRITSGIVADNSLGLANIADNAIDATKIAQNSILTRHIDDNQITNAQMADDAIGVAELSATGTASSSTYLRGDNSWAAAGADFDTAITINDSGADVDFRVESNNNANTLFVDGGNDNVGIGTASPTSLLYLADTANITITLDPTTGDADAWTINAVDDGGTAAFDIRNVDTSERSFIIKEGGNVLMPYQPAFGGGRNAGYMTDDQVWVADRMDHANVGSHYNTSNGKFTAPVAGTYFFSANMTTADGSGNVQAEWHYRKNGSVIKSFRQHTIGAYHMNIAGQLVITLAANDYIEIYVADSGTSSGWLGSALEYNSVCGFLIG